jgi:hypothetical protein
MIKLHYAPKTRSLRILWLLEELGLPYELVRGEFEPTSTIFFQQKTPLTARSGCRHHGARRVSAMAPFCREYCIPSARHRCVAEPLS